MITGEITSHDSLSTIDVPVDPDDPLSPVVATLFPEIRMHGTVEPLIVPNVPSFEDAVEGLPAALFEGTYRPQVKTLRSQQGEFVVQVFDQGEPGTSQAEITGTASPSSSSGAPITATPAVATSRAATSRSSRRSTYVQGRPVGARA